MKELLSIYLGTPANYTGAFYWQISGLQPNPLTLIDSRVPRTFFIDERPMVDLPIPDIPEDIISW